MHPKSQKIVAVKNMTEKSGRTGARAPEGAKI